jgi:hypothetical protein
MSATTLVRQPVQQNVYYIESATGRVFTYDPKTPTYIGDLVLLDDSEKHLISKTNGCLSHARVRYLPNIKEIMARLRATSAATSAATSGTTSAATSGTASGAASGTATVA